MSHINHVDAYYVFPFLYCLNTCSAGDNYSHVWTVDFFLPTKSLGMRLGLATLNNTEIRPRVASEKEQEAASEKFPTVKVIASSASRSWHSNSIFQPSNVTHLAKTRHITHFMKIKIRPEIGIACECGTQLFERMQCFYVAMVNFNFSIHCIVLHKFTHVLVKKQLGSQQRQLG